MFGRQKVATIVAEFLGTGVLTLVFLSVLRSQLASAGVFFIIVPAALALVVMCFALGRLSGGYFNPALTLGAWTTRQLSTVTALAYIAAQFLGAFLAYLLFTYLVSNTLPSSNAKYNSHVLVAEITGTAIFAFGWAAALAYQRLSHVAYAAMAGVSYIVGVFAASSILGLAFLNPALALGAKTWTWGTYVLGPVIGAVVGFGLYQLLFASAGAVTVAEPAKAAVEPAVATKRGKTTAKAATVKRAAKKPVRRKK